MFLYTFQICPCTGDLFPCPHKEISHRSSPDPPFLWPLHTSQALCSDSGVWTDTPLIVLIQIAIAPPAIFIFNFLTEIFRMWLCIEIMPIPTKSETCGHGLDMNWTGGMNVKCVNAQIESLLASCRTSLLRILSLSKLFSAKTELFRNHLLRSLVK